MRETDFQKTVRTWLKEHDRTCAVEAKVARTHRFFFSAVKAHQVSALRAAKHGTLIHKPHDAAPGYKPCDFLALGRAEAYIAIRFPSGNWYLLDIDAFLSLRTKQKSITEDALQNPR